MKTSNSRIILEINDLSCGYGNKPVVENFNLQVEPGECVAFVGPNGCGKSTILRAIYQLCVINSGTIAFNGHLLNGKTPEQVKKLGIAYFMQKNAVFAKLSIKENLLLSFNGVDSTSKRGKIEEIIALFPDIGKWLNKTAGLLSGGQRQQLAMAMLLSQNAQLWLLDEFTAGLDPEKSENFLQLILRYSGKTTENPRTIIFVEHKTEIIHKMADRVINIKGN